MTDIYLDPARKHDAVLLFDVTDGNPNGDPDNSGAPRTDLETGHGIVTDVAIKRKIRDMVSLIAPGRKGYDIYVEADVALEERHLRAYAGLGADPKAKAKPVGLARDWMIEHFFDVRMFGAVMASKIAPAGKTRGPVQLTFARSVDPVLVVENGITRVTQTRQADIDEGQRTEMGTKWTIPYALYRGVIHFSAPLAAKAKVTHDDLDVLARRHLDVRARPRGHPRRDGPARPVRLHPRRCTRPRPRLPAQRRRDRRALRRRTSRRHPGPSLQ